MGPVPRFLCRMGLQEECFKSVLRLGWNFPIPFRDFSLFENQSGNREARCLRFRF